MKENLEPNEIALIEVVKNKWLDLAFNKCAEGVDKEKFENGVKWVYDKFLSLPMPNIIYCDSVIEAAIKISLVKDCGKALDDFMPEMVKSFTEGGHTPEFREYVKNNLSLRSNYIGWGNYGWVSFYDYFTQIGVINHEDFNTYKTLIESNIFECFEFEEAIFAVLPPVKVNYNQNNIPHNIDGASITFRDGTCFYHINGFSISEELFTKLNSDTYSFKEFISEPNEEIKSAVIAYLEEKKGPTGVYDFIKDNLTEVDTYVDKKSEEYMEGTTKSMNVGVYTLFKGSVNDIDIAYVRCFCPSTDRMFFLGVSPDNTNAKDAIASLSRVPAILKSNIKTISRQGEKFSITFDEETTEKLKNNFFTNEQLNEYTNLTGDEYFGLMKYEF